MPALAPWEREAHRVVGLLCRSAYERANRLQDGRLRRRYVPYSIPEDAEHLVAALGLRDRVEAERRVKVYLLSYDGMNVRYSQKP